MPSFFTLCVGGSNGFSFSFFLVPIPFIFKKQLKPYIASTASKVPPEIRRRPGQTL
jgi:hypothetical protein